MSNHQFEEEICLLFYMLKRSSRNDAVRFVQKDSPDMIKGLTPYQILGKLTSQTQKTDVKFAGRKDKRWRVKQLYQKIHTTFHREEPMYIIALQGHPGENRDISTLCHKKIEKGYATLLYHVGSSRHEVS